MKIDNRLATKELIAAIRRTDFDCAEWPEDVLEKLALELLVELCANGMFIVKLV